MYILISYVTYKYNYTSWLKQILYYHGKYIKLHRIIYNEFFIPQRLFSLYCLNFCYNSRTNLSYTQFFFHENCFAN